MQRLLWTPKGHSAGYVAWWVHGLALTGQLDLDYKYTYVHGRYGVHMYVHTLYSEHGRVEALPDPLVHKFHSFLSLLCHCRLPLL